MTKAILYARGSTPDIIDMQKRALVGFCDEKGLEVVSTFEDTGRTGPGLDGALDAARSAPDAAVVVVDLTRLGRDVNSAGSLQGDFTVVAIGS